MMKRAFLILLTLTLILSLFSACGSETPTTTSSDNISNYIIEYKGETVLVLPESKYIVDDFDYSEDILTEIDPELFKKAETQLIEKCADASETPYFFLQSDNDGYLCLTVEVVVKIDPPTVEGGEGCGVDHDHEFTSVRITTKNILAK